MLWSEPASRGAGRDLHRTDRGAARAPGGARPGARKPVNVKYVKGRWCLVDKDGTSRGDYATFQEAHDMRRFLLLAPRPFTLSR